VRIPLRDPGDRVASYKIARRHEQDISAVCATFRVRLQENRISSIRLAFGGMAATARRAVAAEAALTGQDWSLSAIAAAQEGLNRDFQPLTDMRASGEYRLTVAAALLERFFRACAGEAVVMLSQPVSVAEASA
jgi:xanthine dehydrogenase small subunit